MPPSDPPATAPDGPADPRIGSRLAALAHGPRARALLTLASADARAGAVGAHRSRSRGAGTEFADHKAYAPGDDLRQLDWRVLARSDRLVVRQHESPRALRAEVVVDVSRSMEYGTVEGGGDRPGTKSEAAAFVATLLGARLLRQGDGINLSLAGAGVQTLPPRRGEPQLEAWCRDVAHALPAREPRADLDEAVARAVARLRGPGLLAVCGDALDENQGWIQQLVEARAAGHGVLFVHLIDPSERDLPFTESAGFLDPEGGAPVQANPDRVRRRYRELFATHLDGIRSRVLDAGGDHLVLVTGEPVGPALGAGIWQPRRGRRWS
jgi:uncharacterized protein (DUF58 family)